MMAGCRALLGAMKFSPSGEEWDPSPPHHHCPDSDDGTSEPTWAWPSCCCRTWNARRDTVYVRRAGNSTGAGAAVMRKNSNNLTVYSIGHYCKVAFILTYCCCPRANRSNWICILTKHRGKLHLRLCPGWDGSHGTSRNRLGTGAGQCNPCFVSCHVFVVVCTCSTGGRLMRCECMLPSAVVFLRVMVKVNLSTREGMHGWWRQGHISPACPIWFSGLCSTLHLLFLPNLCTWGWGERRISPHFRKLTEACML